MFSPARFVRRYAPMMTSYLKIAWRNLLRNKSFSIINITGLAIGMAGAVLILLWIYNEMSFDGFHANRRQLYAVWSHESGDGKINSFNASPKPLGPAMLRELPEISGFTRTHFNGFTFTTAAKNLPSYGIFADTAFFRLFTFPMLAGNAASALSGVNNVVLTESLARRLFGTEDPMNKTLQVKGYDNVTVTGVMKDPPDNSSLLFEFIMPVAYMEKLGWHDGGWANTTLTTYVMTQPGTDEARLNRKLRRFINTHAPEVKNLESFLHPMRDWRLYSRFSNGVQAGGRIETVRLFAVIAAFILLIACINFMNLSTARSEKRAREVGVRKAAGAARGSLVFQFVGESLLIALLAGLLALLAVCLVLPSFNTLIGQQAKLPWQQPWFWGGWLAFVFITGLLAGSYPAFYLSSFRPALVLKGAKVCTGGLVRPRKVLVVTQFTFAIVLIIATLVVHRQIRHAQQREAGYAKNGMIWYESIAEEMQEKYPALRNELLEKNIAVSVSKASSPVTQRWNGTFGIKWRGKPEGESISTDLFSVDGNFAQTAGLQLTQGRDIDIYKYKTDSGAVLLNETAVKTMGFETPLGEELEFEGKRWTVVGVVKDFLISSPFQATAPMVITGPARWTGVVHIRFNPAVPTAESVRRAEAVFAKFNPGYAFEYRFADSEYEMKFRDARMTANLALLFTVLTIVIACLGLFGLAAYMAVNRTREIGIRKVLGASVLSITVLLSREFLQLVGLALLIASPVAWWLMNGWLRDFAYRITIGWQVFALAGGTAVAIALLTVSWQALRAAMANPAGSLRAD